jgi:hypothetical protein
VIGASDATGSEVRDRPVSPGDLIGSIYELLGVDRGAQLPHPQGLDVRVMDAPGGVATGGRLSEIM